MQQELFYVSRAGQQEGPFSLDEIVHRIQIKSLDLSDYLYDEAQADWVILMAHAEVGQRLKALKPATPPPQAQTQAQVQNRDQLASVASPAATPEWFVLKGDNKFGPFAYTEVVRLLQERSIHEYDYVWHADLPRWERVATLPDFSPDAIRQLRDSGHPGVNEIFFRRRHARCEYRGSILVHDNKRVFKAQGFEIGAGGAGIVFEDKNIEKFELGTRLFLHFKPGDGVPPFNVVCEVVSLRQYQAGEMSTTQYGLKFTNLEEKVQESVNEYALKQMAA